MDVRQPARTTKHTPLYQREPHPEMRLLQPEIAHMNIHALVLLTIKDMEREAADGFTANHKGQLAYYNPDEREAKRKKPIALVENRGRRTIILVGGEMEHEGALSETAEEMLHYGQDVSDYALKRDRPNVQQSWSDAVEMVYRNQQGITVNGPLPTKRHAPSRRQPA